MTEGLPNFDYGPAEGRPGWHQWRNQDRTRFNAAFDPLFVRVEGDVARIQLNPQHWQSNLHGRLHGGAVLAFIDMAVFAGAHALGASGAMNGMTIDLATQFVGGASLDRPVEARVELLRETGRLLFMRGLLVQEGQPTVASFTATLRKASPAK
jgi:uncharacterized protein (TIGR00369 family)